MHENHEQPVIISLKNKVLKLRKIRTHDGSNIRPCRYCY